MGLEIEIDLENDLRARVDNLNLNIVSIVAGVLVALILITWINVIKTWCEHVIEDDRHDRYSPMWRKIWAAIVMTLLGTFIIVILYLWVEKKYW